MSEAPMRAGQNQVDLVAAASMTAGITPELVREVTEKVYALLLADLKRERERMNVTHGRSRFLEGGQHP